MDINFFEKFSGNYIAQILSKRNIFTHYKFVNYEWSVNFLNDAYKWIHTYFENIEKMYNYYNDKEEIEVILNNIITNINEFIKIYAKIKPIILSKMMTCKEKSSILKITRNIDNEINIVYFSSKFAILALKK